MTFLHVSPRLCHRGVQLARAAACCIGLALMSLPAAANGVEFAAEATKGADPHPRFNEALAAYERNHWPQAYQMLADLADQGHGEAARLALQMWRYGPALYRTEFSATARQVERWTQLWGCTGDVTGTACVRAALHSP